MISIQKNLKNIPLSLRTDTESIQHAPAKTTYERRNELIAAQQYPPSDQKSAPFDRRYKYPDIKEALKGIYHNKCAYCETYDPSPHVEHYRPKRGGYHWLAYSWDNLIISCSKCNTTKGNKFPIVGQKITFGGTPDELEQINTLSAEYDAIEQPLLLMPERMPDDVVRVWAFERDGSIVHNNDRINQSCETYGLNREDLCKRRKKLWDELENQIVDSVASAKGDKVELYKLLKSHIRSFMRQAKDEEYEYLAFRRYVLKSGWIEAKVIELTVKGSK